MTDSAVVVIAVSVGLLKMVVVQSTRMLTVKVASNLTTAPVRAFVIEAR